MTARALFQSQAEGDYPPNPMMEASLFPTSGLMSLLPPELRVGRINQFYGYTFSFLTLAASATSTASINVQADADFIICFAQCQVTSSDDATILPYVPQMVLLRDTGASNTLTDQATPFGLVYGDAQSPGIFQMPYFLRRSGTLQITHQNLEATARNVRGVFMGFRSWPDPAFVPSAY